MAQVVIRKIDDDAMARLKARARRKGVSLEQELRTILVETASRDEAGFRGRAAAFRRKLAAGTATVRAGACRVRQPARSRPGWSETSFIAAAWSATLRSRGMASAGRFASAYAAPSDAAIPWNVSAVNPKVWQTSRPCSSGGIAAAAFPCRRWTIPTPMHAMIRPIGFCRAWARRSDSSVRRVASPNSPSSASWR